MIGENPGLFKFCSLSRSFQIITSIPESKSTLATFQLTPSRLFVHPENTMNFTIFGSSKAADDGLSTLFNYSPSHLFQKHQASNSPLQTRFPSRQIEAVEGKIFDTRQRIFVPEVYRRLQEYSEFYLDVEGTDIQSAFVGSDSKEILDRGRVFSVAHNNYNELEKLLFKHKRFYLKPYELDYSQTEAKKSPPTATPWAKQLRTVLDKAKEENKDFKGWFVIPAWDAQVVAATFRMLGSTSALFPLLPYISSVICEAGSDPRGHLGVTWGVYLCAGKPPLADIILSHPPDLTRCDSVIGLVIAAMSGNIQYRGAASGDLYIRISGINRVLLS